MAEPAGRERWEAVKQSTRYFYIALGVPLFLLAVVLGTLAWMGIMSVVGPIVGEVLCYFIGCR